MRFKEGDKVRVKTFKERPWYWNPKMSDVMGEVVTIECIAFDSYIIKGKERTWALNESDVEPTKDECIVIYREDNLVIAHDKATGKKAIAKCSPEDEFDFYTGCKIAFGRLTGKKTPVVEKLLNAKICVLENSCQWFTKGAIYEIKDGKIKDNDGTVLPFGYSFYDMEDVKDYFSKQDDWKHKFPAHFDPSGLKFIEVVE